MFNRQPGGFKRMSPLFTIKLVDGNGVVLIPRMNMIKLGKKIIGKKEMRHALGAISKKRKSE
jgi:hypothetical protein